MKFQAFWHGRKLSPYELVCIKSFLDHGHELDLYCYQPVEADGVGLKDAAEIVPPNEMFFGKGRHTGCFSNLFRFALLHQRGGWWIDLDMVCMSRSMPQAQRFFARQDDHFVNTAVLAAPVGDRLIENCLQRASRIGRRGDAEGIRTGPYLLTKLVREMGIEREVQPASTCYPIRFQDAFRIVDPEFKPELSGAFMVHLWSQMLGWYNIDRWLMPPAGSLMRQFADRHQVQGWRDWQ